MLRLTATSAGNRTYSRRRTTWTFRNSRTRRSSVSSRGSSDRDGNSPYFGLPASFGPRCRRGFERQQTGGVGPLHQQPRLKNSPLPTLVTFCQLDYFVVRRKDIGGVDRQPAATPPATPDEHLH